MELNDKDYKTVQSALYKKHKRLSRKGKNKKADDVQFLMYRIGKDKWMNQQRGASELKDTLIDSAIELANHKKNNKEWSDMKTDFDILVKAYELIK